MIRRSRIRAALHANRTQRVTALRRARARLKRSERRTGRRRISLQAGATCLLLGSFATGFVGGAPVMDAVARSFGDEELTVRSVAVAGASRVSARDVALAAAIAPHDPGARAALHERLQARVDVEGARVVWLPPSTVLIRVVERAPVAVVRAGPQRALTLVDARGVPFAPAKPGDRARLPTLVTAEPASADRPDPRLAQAVGIVQALASETLPPARVIEVDVGEPAERPSARLQGLRARVILGPSRVEEKLARLARLLRAELGEVAAADVIDLRFADRVILRSSPRTGAGTARPRMRVASPGADDLRRSRGLRAGGGEA